MGKPMGTVEKQTYLSSKFGFMATRPPASNVPSVTSRVWLTTTFDNVPTPHMCFTYQFKGMEHVPNIFMSFNKYLFLEVINILI